ncbi:ribosomal protein S18-alanine N-acetyltransferase [Paenibacillus hamazuiensis]|uniref:ribosomal protein S18-alanine N-acetyltransferase n=1 Tax=Paenibacillus hamazuiensis TaxID=2936508 RepID=UPI00200E4CC1|nr:ribosomal protein S18-alanine N-acetyltransferase [Paenibacillus hamazuiensis]
MEHPAANLPDLPDAVTFRSMRLEDIPAICAIEQEAFTTPWTAGAFQNELTSNQFAHYLVMVHGSEIAGYGGMWLIMEEAHVTNIAVKKEFRGQKLGERLLRELMRSAGFLGAVRMTLEVRASNYIAQKLYEKMGFYSVGVRRGYYTDNREDAIIMWVDLQRQKRTPR